jgi:hypothetical protein
VGFPAAVVARRRGFPADAQRFYLTRQHSPIHDAWWTCAQGEAWLTEPKGVAPKAVLQCERAEARPYLDGKLDDPVWQRAKKAELRSPRQDDANWPAAVMLAYDDQFLYLAARSVRAAGVAYDAGAGPRPRDPDLTQHDRIELLLDLDRDYVTYYRLVIDHRGWPAEDCWGDPTWDPTWFVAAALADEAWTAEAAIPLDQLTGGYPTAGTVWSVGLQRVVPNVGLQSFSQPASTDVVPEGFGYLIFE